MFGVKSESRGGVGSMGSDSLLLGLRQANWAPAGQGWFVDV